jgi:hypothetical protein
MLKSDLFHLAHHQTNDEYEDDTTVIPRNTSVLVARKPAQVKNSKNASRYLSAAAPLMPKAFQKAANIYTKPAVVGPAIRYFLSVLMDPQSSQSPLP